MNELGLINRGKALESLLGWMAYAVNGDTYFLRRELIANFNKEFHFKE
jgi:hypothetical protein